MRVSDRLFTPRRTTKLSQGPVKSAIGYWTCPHDNFGLHQEGKKTCQSDHESEVPKRHMLRLTSSTNMVHRGLCRERQKRCYSRKKANVHNKETTLALFVFFVMKCVSREEKTKRRWRPENGRTWIFSPNCLFHAYVGKKIQHIHFWVHGHSSSWSTFGLHLVRGPKAL